MPILRNSRRWSDHLSRIGRAKEETENRNAFLSRTRENALQVMDQVSDPKYQSGIRENKREHERDLLGTKLEAERDLSRENLATNFENEKTLRSLPAYSDLSRETIAKERMMSNEKIARIGAGRGTLGNRKYLDESNAKNFMGKYGITDYNGTIVSDVYTDEQMKKMQVEAAEKGLNIYFDKGKVTGIAPNVAMPTKLNELTEEANSSAPTNIPTSNPLYSYRDERGKIFSTTNKADIPEKYLPGVRVYQSGAPTNTGQPLNELSPEQKPTQNEAPTDAAKEKDFITKFGKANPEQKQIIRNYVKKKAAQGDPDAIRMLPFLLNSQEEKPLERTRPQTPSAYSRNPSVLSNWNKTGLAQIR